tara:strand:- start:503 stop:781 length:279 start_codon:yes stop_codon:yes gene_type:complete
LKKDYFHSCLQDRLQYAQEFAKDYTIYLQSVEFTKKTEREFYKNNRILFMLNKILNLPTNTLKLIKVLKSKFILRKCLNEIEVIKRELKNYE